MADVIIPYEFLCRGGTQAALTSANEIPKRRQLYVEVDTGLTKLGDGSTHYNDLDYCNIGFLDRTGLVDGSLIYYVSDSDGDRFVVLPPGTNGQYLKLVAGVPEWATAGGGSGGPGSQIGYAYASSSTAASTTSSIPNDDTIPQITEGAAYTSVDVAYSPQSATSLLEIEVNIPYMSASNLTSVACALFQSGVSNAIAVAIVTTSSANYNYTMQLRAVVSAASTSSRTYTIRFGPLGGSINTYIMSNSGGHRFGTSSLATMTVKEIAQ